MAKPYPYANEVESTIATGNPFTHGTDASIVLTSAADFDSAGGYIRVGAPDAPHWALYEYTGISTNTLTGLTACTLGNVESEANYEFLAGTVVYLINAAEFLNDLRTDVPLLAGRSGGQTLIGGTDASDGLVLTSTSHATKGVISIGAGLYVDEVNTRVGIGTATAPDVLAHLKSATTTELRLETAGAADPTLSFKTTNTAHQVDISMDENSSVDKLTIQSTVNDLSVEWYAPDTKSAGFLLSSGGTNKASLAMSASDELLIANNTSDKDMRFNIVDGGVTTEMIRLKGYFSSINLFGNVNPGSSAHKVVVWSAGTAPTTPAADAAQMWVADIAAGHAALHIRNENDTVLKLYQQAHIIDADGNLADITTKFNTLLSYLENNGLLASA